MKFSTNRSIFYPISLGLFILIQFCFASESHIGGSVVGSDNASQKVSLQISYTLVKPGDLVPRFNSETKKRELIKVDQKAAEQLNEKYTNVKTKLESFVTDPNLRARGVENYIQTREIELSISKISHSGDVITLNPIFMRTDEEILAVFVHEELHTIVHNQVNHEATEREKFWKVGDQLAAFS